MAKQQRATDALNLALSRISSGLAVAKEFTEKGSATDRAIDEALKGCHEAFEQMRAIANYASMI
jgi:hypothetical protein